MTRILLTIVLFALLPLSTASAQSPRFDRIPFERRNDVARVEITVNLFVAGQNDTSADAEKLREGARRMIYEMAGKECEILRAVIAEQCELKNVNVRISRQQNRNDSGFHVNGSASYQITPK